MGKLVRDLVPSLIEKSGKTPIHYFAKEDEYKKLLFEKLKEETQEFLENKSLEDFADILEVMDAVQEAMKFTKENVQAAKDLKHTQKGAFKRKIILVCVEGEKNSL